MLSDMSGIAKELLKVVLKYLIASIPLFVALFFIHQNYKLKLVNDSLNKQLAIHEVIYKTTQSAITLHYQVSLDNIKAKQLEDSEHVKVKTVIKTVLKDNECANTAMPDDVVNQLQQQERNIRSRSANTYSSTLNK